MRFWFISRNITRESLFSVFHQYFYRIYFQLWNGVVREVVERLPKQKTISVYAYSQEQVVFLSQNISGLWVDGDSLWNVRERLDEKSSIRFLYTLLLRGLRSGLEMK